MTQDEKYMARCIELAKMGQNTSPNPKVGSVIVHKNRIIGEGYHDYHGGPHAEVNAINSVQDPSLLKESTIYVSLEPCAHFGKTPPCSNLIIEKGIPNVVVGCRDPFEAVNGKGIEKLEKASLNVQFGVLENECRELNKDFFIFHKKKRPFIILKWAESPEGFMDINRDQNEKGVFWISSPETKKLVHKWRSECDVILNGSNTIINDNPELTVREIVGKNPLRIVVDRKGRIPADSKVFNKEAATLVFGKTSSTAECMAFPEECSELEFVLDELYRRNKLSLFVEGGRALLESFLNKGLWDEIRIIKGSNSIAEGLKAPVVNIPPYKIEAYAQDTIHYYR